MKKDIHPSYNKVYFECSCGNHFYSFSTLKNMKFYFAHSYFVECKEEYIQATCVHDHEFPAIIRSEKIIGIQFHPEKSHQNGIFWKIFQAL